jgi:tripartite-type tricarboxylate transporter receptor subunit TctC
MVEQGLKDFVVASGFAMFAPAGTAETDRRPRQRRAGQALKDPKVSKTLLDRGAEPNGSTPEAT